jgi:hypothetical protein
MQSIIEMAFALHNQRRATVLRKKRQKHVNIWQTERNENALTKRVQKAMESGIGERRKVTEKG